MATVVLVHRRTDEVGRRLGFMEVTDKLAEVLIKKGVAKATRQPRKRKPAPSPEEAKGQPAAKKKDNPVDILDLAPSAASTPGALPGKPAETPTPTPPPPPPPPPEEPEDPEPSRTKSAATAKKPAAKDA